VAELDTAGIAAVLAADAQTPVRVGRAARAALAAKAARDKQKKEA